MKIITKSEASRLKLKRYFTNKACKHGHIAERFVSTCVCVECNNNRKKKYYKNNKESCINRDREWKKNNNTLVNKYSKEWAKRNPEYCLAIRNQRRAAEKQAIPKWYATERLAIINTYKEAKQLTKDTGVVHHVDHIIPLRHKKVCGIHCLDNLQILTEAENLSKSNKFS